MSKTNKPEWPCRTPPKLSPADAKAIREKTWGKGGKEFVTPTRPKWWTGKRPPGAKTLFD